MLKMVPDPHMLVTYVRKLLGISHRALVLKSKLWNIYFRQTGRRELQTREQAQRVCLSLSEASSSMIVMMTSTGRAVSEWVILVVVVIIR
jgi:hypothetical protein